MCFLVILGLLMGWVESAAHPSVRDIPEPVEQDMDGELVEHDWYCPLPKPPEMYLLPQRIPVKGDGLPAVAEAERVVRSRR